MPLSRRCSELVGRAQLASLLAERAFRPTEDLPYEGGVAVGCELSRQGAYWVLSAHREHWAPESPLNAGTDSRPADSLDTLWSSADRELPEQAAGSSAQLERLSADVLGKSFTDFAELAASKQTELAARLHAFSVRLTEPLLAPQRELER